MKSGIVVSCVQKLLDGLKCEFLADAAHGRSESVDFAVLKVAMAVAALDGTVGEAELAEFEQLAGSCAIPEGERREKAFEACLRFAGYIELQARRLPHDKLLELFAEESLDVLPASFFRGDMSQVRRAFATWTAIAMSDNYYSGVERKAIRQLRDRIEGAAAAVDNATVSMAATHFGQMAGTPLTPGVRMREAPTVEFLSKVEGAVSRLKHEATAQQAAVDLENLIKG